MTSKSISIRPLFVVRRTNGELSRCFDSLFDATCFLDKSGYSWGAKIFKAGKLAYRYNGDGSIIVADKYVETRRNLSVF
jgi:hypothetical protein